MKKYSNLFLLLIGFVLSLGIQSCSTTETDVFGKERLLYFERQVKRPTDLSYEWMRVDTTVISFLLSRCNKEKKNCILEKGWLWILCG